MAVVVMFVLFCCAAVCLLAGTAAATALYIMNWSCAAMAAPRMLLDGEERREGRRMGGCTTEKEQKQVNQPADFRSLAHALTDGRNASSGRPLQENKKKIATLVRSMSAIICVCVCECVCAVPKRSSVYELSEAVI